MEVHVIGIEHVDYIAKDKSRKLGLKLFTTFPAKPEALGLQCKDFYFSESKAGYLHKDDIQLDDNIRILFNQYGNSEDFEIL